MTESEIQSLLDDLAIAIDGNRLTADMCLAVRMALCKVPEDHHFEAFASLIKEAAANA